MINDYLKKIESDENVRQNLIEFRTEIKAEK